ncbi:hypothetical protein Tco_0909132 [Tanacetum coccineum]|uniref:Uncharacterized protein n=1 Tax=Tanacetum coccineum TaxID=301880 RepID=A0ABQ5CQX3_9ASTR
MAEALDYGEEWRIATVVDDNCGVRLMVVDDNGGVRWRCCRGEVRFLNLTGLKDSWNARVRCTVDSRGGGAPLRWFQTTLPRSFWDYALKSTARILNMVPTKKVDKTPYEVWHGQAPKLSYLKV